jgi:hypothetical protein
MIKLSMIHWIVLVVALLLLVTAVLVSQAVGIAVPMLLDPTSYTYPH